MNPQDNDNGDAVNNQQPSASPEDNMMNPQTGTPSQTSVDTGAEQAYNQQPQVQNDDFAAYSAAAPQAGQAPMQPQAPVYGQQAVPTDESDKNYILLSALSYFFGTLGIDRFYLGYTASGIFKLLTFGGLGIWYLIDLIRIVFGKLRDKSGKLPYGYHQYSKIFKLIVIITIIVQFLFIVPFILFTLVFSAMTGVQSRARDNEKITDIKVIHQQAENYFSSKGYYPTSQALEATMASKGTSQVEGDSSGVIEFLQNKTYAYEVSPVGCDNQSIKCTSFILSVALENGSSYETRNLN
ncbi:hypothetical protein BH23PAT1_BH23PAT1_1320 [soil metagenome]